MALHAIQFSSLTKHTVHTMHASFIQLHDFYRTTLQHHIGYNLVICFCYRETIASFVTSKCVPMRPMR